MSEAKCRHLVYRIVPLICFFKHRLAGHNKAESAHMVSQGCLLHARTIQRLAQEFLSDKYVRYVNNVKHTDNKDPLTFAPFKMGVNRNHVSIMYDEKLRARATVWIRMNNVKKKGKPNLRVPDFLKYLQTDLLKDSGTHTLTHH